MKNKINIAIKLVVRNKSDYLHEWLQYYISMGFKNYIIYDDESSDGTKEIIDQYSNIINIHYHIINTSLRKHHKHVFKYKQYDYILFVDTDEFLYISPNVDFKKFLVENYKNKNSVIQIPGLEMGNKDNYHKKIKNLECLKYNYTCKPGYKGNTTLTIKPNDKFKTYFTKHIFSPKYSEYHSGHTSKPNKDYNIVSEFNQLKFTGKWYIQDKVENIYKYNIILFNFDTKTHDINTNNCKKYRSKCIHKNRADKKMINKKLNQLTIRSDIHITYSKKIINDFFKQYGYYFIRNFFDRKQINIIHNDACNIYKNQMVVKGITNNTDMSTQDFETNMKILFDKYPEIFINCGKQCQHLINLWKLSLDDKLLSYLHLFGIKTPHVSTRPVLFSNSKHIAKKSIHHTVPAHQDWASMQGSINSIVAWIPLININQELGPIALVPESHKEGLLTREKKEAFGLVDKYSEDRFISFDVKQGDVILFNSFLVHKSGNNITDNIRWSCHMRYNDLNEKSFIDRGYPHAYIYKPIDDFLTPELDTKVEINHYLINQ